MNECASKQNSAQQNFFNKSLANGKDFSNVKAFVCNLMTVYYILHWWICLHNGHIIPNRHRKKIVPLPTVALKRNTSVSVVSLGVIREFIIGGRGMGWLLQLRPLNAAHFFFLQWFKEALFWAHSWWLLFPAVCQLISLPQKNSDKWRGYGIA